MPTYRIIYAGQHTWVSSNTLADAVAYVLKTHGEPGENEETALQACRIKVIDLLQAEPVASAPVRAAKPKPAAPEPKPAASAVDADEVTHREAMALLGAKSQMVSDAKYNGLLVRGKSKGSVTRTSVEAYIAKRALAPERLRDSAARMRMAKAAKQANREEEMVREEKLAKELGITEERVRSIKQRHNITGGFGWIDRTAFLPAFERSLNED